MPASEQLTTETARVKKTSGIKSPKNIPVAVYVQEAETLQHIASDDRELLIAKGLDPEFIDCLPDRAAALRKAEAEWNFVKTRDGNAVKEWEAGSPAAFELRNDLLKSFRFACRKHPVLLKTISAIAKGKSAAAKIQSLNDLAVLGGKVAEELAAVKFDFSLLDKAALASDEISRLLAAATSERNRKSDAVTKRNIAYTSLKQAVDEIYSCGRYVFKGNKLRLPAYSSAHLRSLRQKRRKKKEKPSVTSA